MASIQKPNPRCLDLEVVVVDIALVDVVDDAVDDVAAVLLVDDDDNFEKNFN